MKIRYGILMILIFSILLVGCSDKNKASTSGKTVEVYYIDSKTSVLVSESYQMTATKTNKQIEEVLGKLKETPKKLGYNCAIPENVPLEYTLGKSGSLLINFNESYNVLTGIDRILSCAAIIKTLGQIKGVEEVQFSINGQPMKDSNGDVIVPLKEEDFIDNNETNMSYKIKLYFSNKEGDALLEDIADINYSGTESIESQILQRLIDGPTTQGMYPSIPKGTKVLSITKADGICTVDFNEKLLDKLPNVKEEIAIYSIVNTLVELPDVNKVSFTINGIEQKKFMESVDLDQPFETRLDLIESPD